MKEITIESQNSYEKGFELGQKILSEIHLCVEFYENLFNFSNNPTAVNLVQKSRELTELYLPEYAKELFGISKATNINLSLIYMINCRSEIINLQALPVPGECTSICKVEEGVIGQNWDWSLDSKKFVVNIRYKKGKEWIQTFTEAGVLAKIGLNSYGLGFNLMFLYYPHSCNGIPMGILIKMLLSQNSIEEVKTIIQRFGNGITGCFGVLIKNNFICFELYGTKYKEFLVSKYFVHANHYVTQNYQPFETSCETDDSYIRYALARMLLNTPKNTVEKILSYDEKWSIFQAPKYNSILKSNFGTVSSITINTIEKKMNIILF